MRILWLSFLLIGRITCGPIGQGYARNRTDATFIQQPFSSGFWYSGTGMSSGPGSSYPLPSLTNPSFAKAPQLPSPQDAIYYGYGSTNMAEGEAFNSGYSRYNSPEVGQYGVAYAASQYDFGAPANGYRGGYGGSADVYGGDGYYGYAPAPQEGFGSVGTDGAGDEILEPVFSDVSDLAPAYSFSSRSNYQRGRAVFAQTRYIPGEPVAPLWPVSRRIGETATAKDRYY